jgi:hypothetical protein
MSTAFGIVDDRDALCPGCKTLPTVDQLMNHHHMIHDCSKEFLSCECPFCIWLCETRVDWPDARLEDVVQQVFVEIAGLPGNAGTQSLYLNHIYIETGKYFGSTRFEMIAKPCKYLENPKYRFDLTRSL